MTALFRPLLLLILMLAAAGLAVAFRPTLKLADTRPPITLSALIPGQVGEWQALPENGAQIVDPRQQAFVNEIYKQTASRTYADRQGRRIMLSVAYVENQSDSLGVHLPEVCYPSQGFLVSDEERGTISGPGNATLPVKRMVATLGPRSEPITYWVTVGDEVIASGTQRKLAQMRHALSGRIPDGMLIRISSIDKDREAAYALQARFARDLRNSLPSDIRTRLYGNSPAS